METIIIAIFYSILAGSVVATQNVFSTQISHKIGMWETTVIVHLFGLIFALIISFIFGKGSYKNISDINKLYLLAGPLGVIIIFSVTMGVSKLGATFAIAIMVISQLSFATVIDCFGFFGMDKIPFNLTKFIGLMVMFIGLINFQLRA